MDTAIRRRLDIASRASLFVYAVTAVAIPVCLVDVTRDLGINLTQAGGFGFVSSFEQFFVLLLSGIAAARFGKIPLLRWGLLFLALGLALFSGVRGYLFALSLVLLTGLGSGLLEALLTPLVEDMHPEDEGRQQNLLHAFWPIGVLVSTLVVGELLSRGVSWRWIFVGMAAMVAVTSLLYPSARKAGLPRSRADFSHMGEILSEPRFWFLGFALFFAGGAEGSITYWIASYIRLHHGTVARAGALGTAAFAVGMAIGRLSVSRLAPRLGLKRIIWESALVALAASLGFILIDRLWTVYVFMVILGLTIAAHWPSLQTYAARVIRKDATLIMIFMSCFGIPGFSSATFLMGWLGDRYGLRTSFLVTPAYLVVLVLLMMFEGRIPLKDSGPKDA